MSKRKITKRQTDRIAKIHEKRRARATQKQTKLVDDQNLGPEQEGLLIAHYYNYVDVEDTNGDVYHCQLRQNLGSVVAGDRVVWRAGKEQDGVVSAVMPRKSILSRPDKYGKIRPIAANIDQLIIVSALIPEPSTYLIDSYIVAAEHLGINPVLLMNKIDLMDPVQQETITRLSKTYRDIDYQVIQASTKTDHGIEALEATLSDKTSIFVGQSGVGKSSLISTLLPDLDIRVGELSEAKGLGVHTTTTTHVFHLPQGGDLIDSPGIREFQLWHLKPEEITQGFKEFREYLGQCKFRNCKHKADPECALRQAVEDGHISDERYQNYLTIIKGGNQG